MQLADSFKVAWVEKFSSDKISFEQIMAIQGKVFRDVPGRKTLCFVLGQGSFFIKIHSGIGWREILKNFSQGKLPVLGASNEYKAIRELDALGIDTMTISGFGERGFNPAAKQSFIITEDLKNTISLEDLCRDWTKQPPSLGLKRALINKVAMIARQLHDNGINHRDFYICHFLLDQELYKSGRLTLYLIDLHRAQIRSKTPRRWLLKDLAGLYFSAMDIGLTQADLFRFLQIYRGKPLREILNDEAVLWHKVSAKAGKLYSAIR